MMKGKGGNTEHVSGPGRVIIKRREKGYRRGEDGVGGYYPHSPLQICSTWNVLLLRYI